MKKNLKLKSFSAAVASLSFGLMLTSSVSAWGPERTTFTMEKPATYPTFNSITNNPTIGDERDFVRVGKINADVTDLKNEIEVEPGNQYLVYIYFHNNASSSINDSAHNYAGVAMQTKMATNFSTVLTPEKKGEITATIRANNSNPAAVWDEAYMTTKTEKVLMHYVEGSAKIYNDWKTNNGIMPDSLFTQEGSLLGLNALNGVIPGCEEYHGVITYVLRADELGGSIDKTVSKDGNDYKEAVNIAPGEEVFFKLAIRNTGDVALTNATVKDVLPEGLTLVPGSVGFSANESTTVEPLSDNIVADGYNFGTIGTGNVIYITYKAVAGSDFDCEGKDLMNKATLIYDSDVKTGDSKEDSATVIVKKSDCGEPETPPLDNCETNPALPECQEKNCKTNPEMEGCQELPSTGPLEIVMAIIVVLGIGGGGYYLYRTRKTLEKTEKKVKGKKESVKIADKAKPVQESAKPQEKTIANTPAANGSSQKPDNMVK